MDIEFQSQVQLQSLQPAHSSLRPGGLPPFPARRSWLRQQAEEKATQHGKPKSELQWKKNGVFFGFPTRHMRVCCGILRERTTHARLPFFFKCIFAYKHNAFVAVKHIHTRRLYSCLHIYQTQKNTFRTHSAHILHTFAFGNRLGSNIHAFVVVRYQTHTRTLLLVTRHICVCLIFCDIASKHIRVCNQTLHIPQKSPKSTREPMRCIL